MAIKDLRKQNESKVDIKEIKKEAFIEAYETILAENVVMTEEELKNTISEAVNKVKEAFKAALGDKYELVEDAIKNETTIDLYTKNELVEEFDEMIKEAIGEENFEIINNAIREKKEIFVLDEELIEEAEDKFIDEIEEKIKEAIGEENYKILDEAIKEKENIYIISEKLIPVIEEKMVQKIKEDLNEASPEGDYQEELRQQIIQNPDLYAAAKSAEDVEKLKDIVCNGIENVECDLIDWEQLFQDLQAVDEKCNKDKKEDKKEEANESITLAEKLIDEGISTEEETREPSSLAEKLI